MISVVIPTLNAGPQLAACLDALVSAAVSGLVREVVVVDGGSTDDTRAIADGFGAALVESAPGRGRQLRAGGAAARGDWLLFLHGDTVLAPAWEGEARALIEAGDAPAGVFALAFAGGGWRARLVAFGAMRRTRWLRAPYGDQGLLIRKSVYEEIGGYREMALFEDVDLIDRLKRARGRKAFRIFDAKAVTSPARYERDGYLRRVLGNALLMARYRLGAAPDALARAYR